MLAVSCHPDYAGKKSDKPVFVVDYSRIYFDGKEWVEKTKTVKGFWEHGGSNFPSERSFPE